MYGLSPIYQRPYNNVGPVLIVYFDFLVCQMSLKFLGPIQRHLADLDHESSNSRACSAHDSAAMSEWGSEWAAPVEKRQRGERGGKKVRELKELKEQAEMTANGWDENSSGPNLRMRTHECRTPEDVLQMVTEHAGSVDCLTACSSMQVLAKLTVSGSHSWMLDPGMRACCSTSLSCWAQV